ncbi:MAG: DNA mismatch repair protein MutS [Spirochaetales bacterium]|nr:DNA mismatch repair protein MutS [Spirochaetales bacterium]
MSKTTPMMMQYQSIKENYKDAILFFRMGDFYEMFEKDAKEASRLLDLTLTQRHGIPMCGIPYHAAKNYIAKILRANKKVAICEQTQLPGPGKGIARREVVEVITPGTVVDEGLLDSHENNYLLCLGRLEDTLALSYLDLSTGDFFTQDFSFENRQEVIKKELARLSSREILIQESLINEDPVIKRLLYEKGGFVVNPYPDWTFDPEINAKRLEKQFGVKNLKGFGFTDNSPSVGSCGILLEYINDNSKSLLPHIGEIRFYHQSQYLTLDESTQRNLELVTNLQDGSARYTLLEILSHYRSSMGGRKLRNWILNPLIDLELINTRQGAVELFYRNQILLSKLREWLSKVLDLERLSARVAMDKAHAKDLVFIRVTLKAAMEVVEALESFRELKPFMSRIDKAINKIKDLIELLNKAIDDDPSILLTEGKMIRKGFNRELDELRELKKNARSVLEKLLEEERQKSGINSLRLKYNRIIGHFFEVTKSNLSAVPPHFIRRQSLVTGDRFTTDALIDKESSINSASESIIELEKKLFLEIREQVKGHISLLLDISKDLSEIDVLQSLAYSATLHGLRRPEVNDSSQLIIVEGRHPVVEAHMASGEFIPNSLHLDTEKGNFVLLTGPNMAGKSTFLRQIALVVLMAQIGSFVPAGEAVIGVVDKIFCRVGASDNLARGESTFLVEMNETANILRSATDKSLLILDEVGRGTSTKDGLSIAWSVVEYILNHIRAKTLFATHFHELTQLAHEGLRNMSMEVKETASEIIFLKQIKEGPADQSYGIHVAQLAGIPAEVIKQAKKRLEQMNEKQSQVKFSVAQEKESEVQASLFEPGEIILEEIMGLKINKTTPLAALNCIDKWQKELKNRN